jgi:hypothetical protein
MSAAAADGWRWAVHGGINWAPSANGRQTAMGQTNLVPFYNNDTETYGVVRAYDPQTLDPQWEFRMTDITWGGVLATASDLGFSGGREGYFMALDARSGALPWRASVGGQQRRSDELLRERQAVRGDSRGRLPVRLRAAVGPQLTLALKDAPKLLLTATPLQNSLLELFGLVSFVDEYAFGDLASFRAQFAHLTNQETFAEGKAAADVHRTLRRRVTAYVPCTRRHPMLQPFTSEESEDRLYHLVSNYLRRDNLQALLMEPFWFHSGE